MHYDKLWAEKLDTPSQAYNPLSLFPHSHVLGVLDLFLIKDRDQVQQNVHVSRQKEQKLPQPMVPRRGVWHNATGQPQLGCRWVAFVLVSAEEGPLASHSRDGNRRGRICPKRSHTNSEPLYWRFWALSASKGNLTRVIIEKVGCLDLIDNLLLPSYYYYWQQGVCACPSVYYLPRLSLQSRAQLGRSCGETLYGVEEIEGHSLLVPNREVSHLLVQVRTLSNVQQ